MPQAYFNISCAIIAGGKSSRFGSNKAVAAWDAHGSVISAVIKSVSHVTSNIMIIAGDQQPYQSLHLPVYPDIIPGYGPLSGIHAALSLSSTDRVLILACDMPAISSHFLEYLISVISWAPVVVPVSTSGPEPLHAIWHRSLMPLIEQFIAQGTTGLRDILSRLPCRFITLKEIIAHGLDPLSLVSANTPDALERLREKIQKGTPRRRY